MIPIRIHVFQHVHFEGLGSMADWCRLHNYPVAYTRFYEQDYRLPELSGFDWLIIMGGPMGVYQENLFPWLKAEKEFIANAILGGKTVLGICLGAQLIASSLGAKVYPNKLPEVGWFPIFKTETGKSAPLLDHFTNETTVFHWHGDTFDLPPQAKQLFFSEACPNQSFLIGNKVLALQCHLEVTRESLEAMLEHVGSDLKEASFVQNVEQIRTGYVHIESNRQLLFQLMDQLG